MVLSNVLYSSSSVSTVLVPQNIFPDGDEKPSKLETEVFAECLCKKCMELAQMFLATSADTFYGTLVQQNRNIEFFFTSYSGIDC